MLEIPAKKSSCFLVKVQNICLIPLRTLGPVHNLSDKEKNFKDFQVMSVVDERLSNDDSSLVFRDKKFCVHHGNDNWFKFMTQNSNEAKNMWSFP